LIANKSLSRLKITEEVSFTEETHFTMFLVSRVMRIIDLLCTTCGLQDVPTLIGKGDQYYEQLEYAKAPG
jgi:hypothetical protein